MMGSSWVSVSIIYIMHYNIYFVLLREYCSHDVLLGETIKSRSSSRSSRIKRRGRCSTTASSSRHRSSTSWRAFGTSYPPGPRLRGISMALLGIWWVDIVPMLYEDHFLCPMYFVDFISFICRIQMCFCVYYFLNSKPARLRDSSSRLWVYNTDYCCWYPVVCNLLPAHPYSSLLLT